MDDPQLGKLIVDLMNYMDFSLKSVNSMRIPKHPIIINSQEFIFFHRWDFLNQRLAEMVFAYWSGYDVDQDDEDICLFVGRNWKALVRPRQNTVRPTALYRENRLTNFFGNQDQCLTDLTYLYIATNGFEKNVVPDDEGV